jgi:hypothetical protein
MSTNSNILRNANDLRITTLQKKQIAAAIREVLTNINQVILHAHEAGKGYVKDKLPMQFAIDGMTFTKMQQYVWCGVIKELKDKNYMVAIDPQDTECNILIKWESDEEKKESQRLLQMLAAHTKRAG